MRACRAREKGRSCKVGVCVMGGYVCLTLTICHDLRVGVGKVSVLARVLRRGVIRVGYIHFRIAGEEFVVRIFQNQGWGR